MKKFLAILIACSLAVVFAADPLQGTPPTAAQASTSGTYSGSIAPRCIVKTPLANADLYVANTDGDGFVQALQGTSAFTYRSNSQCKIDLQKENVTTAPGEGVYASFCGFDQSLMAGATSSTRAASYDGAASVSVYGTIADTNDGILLAGNGYSITCKAIVTGTL